MPRRCSLLAAIAAGTWCLPWGPRPHPAANPCGVGHAPPGPTQDTALHDLHHPLLHPSRRRRPLPRNSLTALAILLAFSERFTHSCRRLSTYPSRGARSVPPAASSGFLRPSTEPEPLCTHCSLLVGPLPACRRLATLSLVRRGPPPRPTHPPSADTKLRRMASCGGLRRCEPHAHSVTLTC